jgi:Right handed beta helix region
MKRRAAVLLFAVVAAAGLSLPPAGAASRPSGDVVVVDDDPDGGCQGRDADFESIQAAIDDDGTEEGDTVLVCAGIYDETVKVTKRGLHLKGANAFRDPTHQRRRPESIVTHIDREGTVQLRADDVTWNGFTILGVREAENGPGMTTSPSHSGYLVRDTIFEDNGVGLHLGASGEHPTLICRNRFIANNEFATGGYGIFADTRARRAVIAYNQFRRHNGAGVFLADRGGVQRDLLIDHNRSVDDKSFATVYGSSRVRLTSNSVVARVFDPNPVLNTKVSAIFIGARNRDVLVHRNRVQAASGNGIDITSSGEPGRRPARPVDVVVSGNKVRHARLAGLHLARGTRLVAVTANLALENGLDCQDESPGVRNTWRDNVGDTSEPPGLCRAPTDEERPDPGKGHGRPRKKDPCTCRQHPRAI